jgi:hypothetical protein
MEGQFVNKSGNKQADMPIKKKKIYTRTRENAQPQQKKKTG